MKQLSVFRSMGIEFAVGWHRDDLDMIIHMFASAAPGEKFTASNGRGGSHWPCDVCNAHNYTETDFHAQIRDALERGPV